MSGVDAYKRTINKTSSNRDTEYRLLAQVTSALIEAKEAAGNMKTDPIKMKLIAEALNWNNEIWSTFMDDCRSVDNLLPEEVRGGILSLGIWVNKETKLAMVGDSDLNMLIAVNRDIMKGLTASQMANDSRTIPGGSQKSSLDNTTPSMKKNI